MPTHSLLAGTGNVVPDLAVACLNVIAALVAVSLLLVLAVSSVAWLYDRHKWIQPIRVAQSGGR